jgi:hypothetical protein
MHLLGTDAYRFALATSLANAHTSLSVISAYVTLPGMKWVLDRLSPSLSNFRVLARWHPEDFTLGASDIEVYDPVRMAGGRFFVLPNLHAKLILVDNEQLFVGSANITALGLKLVPGANREIGVNFTASEKDVSTIDVMFAEAIEVTPNLYEEFRQHVKLITGTTRPIQSFEWPSQLSHKLKTRPKKLWVAELFWSVNPQRLHDTSVEYEETSLHDLILLGFERGTALDQEELRRRFLDSRPWNWLLARLSEEVSHELSFGRLSELLHNGLLDDPKPYRKDVKQLVSNLLGWVQAFGQPIAIIERRNYSQRVILKSVR